MHSPSLARRKALLSRFKKPLIEDKLSTAAFWVLFVAFIVLYGRVFHFVFE